MSDDGIYWAGALTSLAMAVVLFLSGAAYGISRQNEPDRKRVRLTTAGLMFASVIFLVPPVLGWVYLARNIA